MDTSFYTQSYQHYKCIWSGPIVSEGSTENVIPDNLPDIGSVIDCSPILCIRSKECENGKILLSVDVNAQLTYMSEDGTQIEAMPIRSNISVTCSVTESDPSCLCTASLYIRNADCKIINSRKTALRVEIAGEACCYHQEEFNLAEEIEASAYRIETKKDEQSVWFVSDVTEKTFVVSDDFALPTACTEPLSILSEQLSCRVEEIEFLSEKMVFRGRVTSFLLVKDKDSVYPCSHESSFSQICELKRAENALPEVILLPTGTYFDLPDRAGGKIAEEIHILAQIVCKSKYSISYISDAYSNRQPIEPVFKALKFSTDCSKSKLRNTVSESIDNSRDIKNILYSYTNINSFSFEAGTLRISMSLKIVYYRDDGSLSSVNHRMQAEINCDINEGQNVKVGDIQCDTPILNLGGNRIDIRIPIEISLFISQAVEIHSVNEFLSCEKTADCPSLTLLNCKDQSELWSLAKTYHSSIDAILAANEGRTEGLLLIPKCR